MISIISAVGNAIIGQVRAMRVVVSLITFGPLVALLSDIRDITGAAISAVVVVGS